MMNFFVRLFCFFKQVFLFPAFFIWHKIDQYHSIKENWKDRFEGWGLHIFTGRFGGGKTGTAVRQAYKLALRYPQLTILTNLKLTNFPKHTKIIMLKNVKQILEAPVNCLVLIDEIGTIFNSRDFMKSNGKDAVPKILFQHLCQCRHRRMMIYGTCQKWCFLDKQLRDIVDMVYDCKTKYNHPFSRLNIAYAYYSEEYDKAVANPLLPLELRGSIVFVQSNKMRNLYDTMEMVEGMLNMDYDTDSEILANRGEITNTIGTIDKDTKKSFKKVSNGRLKA